jgi:hypothetical protein
MKRKYKTYNKEASALILAVVLTSLLAVIGVVFLLSSRVDSLATSSLSEQKDLNSAVETVISKISEVLADDVRGLSSLGPRYYDYPDEYDKWLACLEPFDDSGACKWQQISDVYDKLNLGRRPQVARIIPEYQDLSEVELRRIPADADGDGVSDSMWVKVDDMSSSKGKDIYAAIRIIDNGAMINLNTVFANPVGPDERKGDILTDIYIDGLVKTGSNSIAKFIENRSGNSTITDDMARQYHTEVSRRVENPDLVNPPYTLYDITDELSLRNRFVIYHEPTITRLESKDCFGNSLRVNNAWTPVDDPCAFAAWKRRMDPNDGGVDPCESDNHYSFRKLLTTYNMDRIITPLGRSMANINDVCDVNALSNLYNAVKTGLSDANTVGLEERAAQITVNLVDYQDADSNVTAFTNPDDGKTYYGFERPCIYISELVHRFVEPDVQISPLPASLINRSYAIELHKPYSDDDYPKPNEWQLVIESYGTFPVTWSGTKSFHVISFIHSGALLNISWGGENDPNFSPSPDERPISPGTIVYGPGRTISLQRLINAVPVTVDSIRIGFGGPSELWATDDGITRCYQRDITPHKCIMRLWDDSFTEMESPTLGHDNIYTDSSPEQIQAHPSNEPFTNVGEIGMLFRKGAYYVDAIDRDTRVGYGTNKNEEDVRLNLQDPDYQNIFNYLTVFDPSKDGINNDGDGKTPTNPDGWIDVEDEPALTPEWKIPGRININTAPWYVIAQLPWVSHELAQAIVAYRDKLDLRGLTPSGPDYYHGGANNSRYQETGIDGLREEPGFASIGELAAVINISDANDYSMSYYLFGLEENDDLDEFPDLTSTDGAADDFEERDVIFARISNLVTVRSDVFTAYILVRIGKDGPQKRVIAILDRSDVYKPGDKVKIVALQQVPDPR